MSGCLRDLQLPPKLVAFRPELGMLEAEGRHTTQVNKAHVSRPHHDGRVASAQLGPSFLDQRNPESAGSRVTVDRLAILARDIVINDDILPYATNTHLDDVATRLVRLLRLEELLNALWLLRKGRQAGDEVAISQASLHDVFRRQAIWHD